MLVLVLVLHPAPDLVMLPKLPKLATVTRTVITATMLAFGKRPVFVTLLPQFRTAEALGDFLARLGPVPRLRVSHDHDELARGRQRLSMTE